MTAKHSHTPIWQPNYVDRKSFKQGYVWRCFKCGRPAKSVDLNSNKKH
jgi:hypothetical protein